MRARLYVVPTWLVCRRWVAVMAIYHLSVKVISRSAGRSAVAAAAYRSAGHLNDERGGTRDILTTSDVLVDSCVKLHLIMYLPSKSVVKILAPQFLLSIAPGISRRRCMNIQCNRRVIADEGCTLQGAAATNTMSNQ